ncbi:MAG: ATP-dependent zinc metalloprotease FtsH [Clostridiales bacterium]|jgi:cell division protease FtsH|nr:ATP-dependent zinc metalloprotease FtsH [Clostridiales bacterium]
MKNKRSLIIIIISVSLFTLMAVNLSLAQQARGLEKISYNAFLKMIDEGKIQKVDLYPERIIITPARDESADKPKTGLPAEYENLLRIMYGYRPNDIKYYTGYLNDPNLVEKLAKSGVEFSNPYEHMNPVLSAVLSWMLPLLAIYVFFALIMHNMSSKMDGRGGSFMQSVSSFKANMEKRTGVTFKDVAGQAEAKESLEEIVDFLHNPGKYTEIGAKQPKGALLVGPPGTGKTLLAKAVAGEAKSAFFSLSGSDFVEMFVGVGASRVRALFKQAQANVPCIIFIDEVDAIGKSRDGSGNDERDQTLNQLLSQMDGFDASKGIVVLAATNRPDVLDKALLRPGRFDRRIVVEKPDLKGREEILAVHAQKVKTGANVDLKKIAVLTPGASGADLANMVNEAALLAVKKGRPAISQEDLIEAVEVVIAGKEKKDRILTEKDKKLVAYHEVGHALASVLVKNSKPVQKITIVPRTKGTLGYVLNAEDEERFIMTRDEIFDEITTFLAGRAAEEEVFNQSTTGAANDIERATSLARRMVAQYGMTDALGLMSLEIVENKYLDARRVSTCSDATYALEDEEVRKILGSCYKRARELLRENREALDNISKFLCDKETLTGDEFVEILRRTNPDVKVKTD